MSIGKDIEYEVRLHAVADHLREALARRRVLLGWDGALRDGARSAPLAEVAASAVVNPHLPIAWPDWPPGVWPKLKALAQKITRRLLAWYINPIVAQQNAFNQAVLRALQDTERANAELAERVCQLEAQLARMAMAPARPTPAEPVTATGGNGEYPVPLELEAVEHEHVDGSAAPGP